MIATSTVCTYQLLTDLLVVELYDGHVGLEHGGHVLLGELVPAEHVQQTRLKQILYCIIPLSHLPLRHCIALPHLAASSVTDDHQLPVHRGGHRLAGRELCGRLAGLYLYGVKCLS